MGRSLSLYLFTANGCRVGTGPPARRRCWRPRPCLMRQPISPADLSHSNQLPDRTESFFDPVKCRWNANKLSTLAVLRQFDVGRATAATNSSIAVTNRCWCFDGLGGEAPKVSQGEAVSPNAPLTAPPQYTPLHASESSLWNDGSVGTRLVDEKPPRDWRFCFCKVRPFCVGTRCWRHSHMARRIRGEAFLASR